MPIVSLMRIVQLGDSPNFSPDGLLSRSHSEYMEGGSVISMITEDLVAEQVAIDSYREIASWLGDFDTTAQRIMNEIQATEEEHADDLSELPAQLPVRGGVFILGPCRSRYPCGEASLGLSHYAASPTRLSRQVLPLSEHFWPTPSHMAAIASLVSAGSDFAPVFFMIAAR